MQTKGDEPTFDPICGERVDRDGAKRLDVARRTYFFCSDRCRERFERQVERHRLRELARMGALLAGSKVRWGQA